MEVIRAAFERCARVLSRRPSLGHATGLSRTRIRQGLICQVEEGPWRLVADVPMLAGSAVAPPTPGVFGRAALGSCLAVGYMVHAAKSSVPILSIEVEVQADYEEGALLGVGAPAGDLELRYAVTVVSAAPDADVQRVIDEADAQSPYLDVFARSQKCRRSVRIVKPYREQ